MKDARAIHAQLRAAIELEPQNGKTALLLAIIARAVADAICGDVAPATCAAILEATAAALRLDAEHRQQ